MIGIRNCTKYNDWDWNPLIGCCLLDAMAAVWICLTGLDRGVEIDDVDIWRGGLLGRHRAVVATTYMQCLEQRGAKKDPAYFINCILHSWIYTSFAKWSIDSRIGNLRIGRNSCQLKVITAASWPRIQGRTVSTLVPADAPQDSTATPSWHIDKSPKSRSKKCWVL